MPRLSSVSIPTELERRRPADPLALDPVTLERDAPDAHWTLAGDAGGLRARCSLWWARTPSLLDHRVGVIGHYAAADAAAAQLLLQRACRELAARGCSVAVGPMDGSTWRRYRVVTERGSDRPSSWNPTTRANGPSTSLRADSDPSPTTSPP